MIWVTMEGSAAAASLPLLGHPSHRSRATAVLWQSPLHIISYHTPRDACWFTRVSHAGPFRFCPAALARGYIAASRGRHSDGGFWGALTKPAAHAAARGVRAAVCGQRAARHMNMILEYGTGAKHQRTGLSKGQGAVLEYYIVQPELEASGEGSAAGQKGGVGWCSAACPGPAVAGAQRARGLVLVRRSQPDVLLPTFRTQSPSR
ncbi:hypothetical protein BDZ91DRAFT_762574 [Kalaharituber pfeilii]|nr:hypothetical protein BDZ91DRAFT_762574 [Kalaharituber pfeilii]